MDRERGVGCRSGEVHRGSRVGWVLGLGHMGSVVVGWLVGWVRLVGDG